MDIIKQLKWRYATKKFDATKKLSSEKLDILKQAFNLTATSFGLQTIKLIIVEDQSLRQSLVAHAYNQKQVLEASHLLVICMQEDILDTDVVAYYDNIKTTRNTPETILGPYREDLIKMMQNMSVTERLQWSKNQAYIALGNLMTVCAIEGIDSCPMEGFLPEAVDKTLQLNKMGLKSVLLLPVGYRDETDIFANFIKVRKSINEAVIEL
ncbi:Putative NAD(P)H nitroreductase [Mariniflexile rhizosphaerae]|uniref:NAD(P)H-dependent oxidoreductase n=1 Tax=unclassified Mariniflexile TaxID=2643887 RepID=UPI000CB13950|nr:NAD(P)H-dependent oxidoreductase [Mariniflexile sp. TRM1-10]AXP82727.1 Putative NAD(P)H nitroreductase [Mariniflexile sp. TRM1-10]PLB18870.1 MAG: Nitroreductase [Flavobacteriaceae bacterium FS1-H7996/R]